MCTHYYLKVDQHIFERYSLNPEFKHGENNDKNFDATPGEFMPVITYGEKYNQLSFMRWGLIPSWARDDQIGQHLFNARAESILEKPSFKIPFRHHRCLIPASAFYERKKEKGQYQSYDFSLIGSSLFSFAGIFDSWMDPNGSEYQSYSIITTAPNALIKSVHSRMPVILKRGDEKEWLSPFTKENILLSLLRPYSDILMTSQKSEIKETD